MNRGLEEGCEGLGRVVVLDKISNIWFWFFGSLRGAHKQCYRFRKALVSVDKKHWPCVILIKSFHLACFLQGVGLVLPRAWGPRQAGVHRLDGPNDPSLAALWPSELTPLPLLATCLLAIRYLLLVTFNMLLVTWYLLLSTCYLILATCCLLLARNCYFLFATCYLLVGTCGYLLLAPWSLLLTTFSLLLAVCYLLISTCYFLFATCYFLFATCYLLVSTCGYLPHRLCSRPTHRIGSATSQAPGFFSFNDMLWPHPNCSSQQSMCVVPPSKYMSFPTPINLPTKKVRALSPPPLS